MSRQELSSGKPWETQYRYSRAVRAGPFFQTSLTSPADQDGRIVCAGDVYGQTRASLAIIGDALGQAGLSLRHVVASRIYMLDTRRWEEAARAHRELVSECRPALSFLGVANFFHPDILVEVEVTAWADSI